MITYEDCLALAELTPEEVDRIAAHEHLPRIVALGLGSSLSRTIEGNRRMREILGDGTAAACARDDRLSTGIAAASSADVPNLETKRLAA